MNEATIYNIRNHEAMKYINSGGAYAYKCGFDEMLAINNQFFAWVDAGTWTEFNIDAPLSYKNLFFFWLDRIYKHTP